MKFFNNFFSFLIAIVLIFSAMSLQVSLALKKDMFSSEFYLERVTTSKIYDKLEKSIYNKFSDYVSKNKLPVNVASDIISPLWIEKQFTTVTNGLISYTLGKTDALPVIDSKTPIDKFNKNLNQRLTEKNIPIDNVANAARQEFLKSFNEIPFTAPWKEIHEEKLKDKLNNYRKYVKIINYAPYVSAFVLLGCILLFFLTTTKLVFWKLWTGYTLIIGGLIPSVTSFIISNSNAVNTYFTDTVILSKTSIFPPNATINLLTYIVNSMLMGITQYGAVLVFLGIAVILIVSIFDTKKDNVFFYKHKPLN